MNMLKCSPKMFVEIITCTAQAVLAAHESCCAVCQDEHDPHVLDTAPCLP